MATGGFEEWDEDFLDQLVQAEELALSTQHPHPPPPPPPPPRVLAPALYTDISYSPPRELSQSVNHNPRVFNSTNGACLTFQGAVSVFEGTEEQETDKLKKELGRVSQKLTLLEKECLQLREERDKKEEQLRAKNNEAHSTRGRNIAADTEVHIQDNHRKVCRSSSNDQVQINVGISVCKAIGVQTDSSVEATDVNYKDGLSTCRVRSKKLIGIWDPPTGSQPGRNIVSKLFVACETDLLHLFGCLSSKLTSKTTVDKHPVQSAEAAKVSYLYSMLTKVNNHTVTPEALLEALVDLCRLGIQKTEEREKTDDREKAELRSNAQHVAIVYRSIRVLGMVLDHCFRIERKFDRRDNVTVEQSPSLIDAADDYGSKCSSEILMRSFNASETVCKNTISIDYWISLFELMHQIAMRNKEEHVRMEAVSIMNMILMRTNAYKERDKFGQVLASGSLARLLRKEAGLGVQNQAVHLLFLLLNCPKLSTIFCCAGDKEEGENAEATNRDAIKASIFEALADCIACSDNSKQMVMGLKLRREAINLLAFLVSSGKNYFENLFGSEFVKTTNFLALILQVLVSETDLEASELVQSSEIFKERTMLIRQALILLNRLVSNPQYSAPVLKVLTDSREVASMTIDVANRLSRKTKWLWQSDAMTRQIRETEIADLGRVFRKRVFTFLGDNIS